MDRQLDHAPCGYFSITDTGVIRSANRTLAKMLGYEREDIVGKHIESFLSLANKLLFHSYFYPHMQLYGHVSELYLSLRSGSQLDVPVLLNGIRQVQEDGETVMDCVVVEMRKRLELEKDILQTKDRLEQLVSETNEANRKLELLHQEYEVKQQELMAMNVRLETMALTDPLTGLRNRRYFQESLIACIASFRRTNTPFSICMFDIDRFKSINDTYGHPVGDLVLKELARLLQASSRETDVAARIGGEEFVLLLAGSDRDSAVRIAENYRSKIQATPMGNLNITASIGVATITAEDSGETLVLRADQALYLSKANGRNRVTHDAELPEQRQ